MFDFLNSFRMEKPFTPVFSGILVGTSLLQSCATIIATPFQTVRVAAPPVGSTVHVNDKEVKTKPIAGSNDVKVRVADGLTAKGRVVRVNVEMDLALIKIDANGFSTFRLPSVSWARLSRRAPSAGGAK